MPTGFFDLSGELRNVIYELVLVHERHIHPWHWSEDDESYDVRIFQTSKVVNREAASIFYGHNTFSFTRHQDNYIDWFLRAIGANNASHIRIIHGHFAHISLSLSKVKLSCTSIQSLKVRVNSELPNPCEAWCSWNSDAVDQLKNAGFNSLRMIASLEEVDWEIEDCCFNEVTAELQSAGLLKHITDWFPAEGPVELE